MLVLQLGISRRVFLRVGVNRYHLSSHCSHWEPASRMTQELVVGHQREGCLGFWAGVT